MYLSPTHTDTHTHTETDHSMRRASDYNTARIRRSALSQHEIIIGARPSIWSTGVGTSRDRLAWRAEPVGALTGKQDLAAGRSSSSLGERERIGSPLHHRFFCADLGMDPFGTPPPPPPNHPNVACPLVPHARPTVQRQAAEMRGWVLGSSNTCGD